MNRQSEPDWLTPRRVAELIGVSTDWLLGASDLRLPSEAGALELESQKQRFSVLPVVGFTAAAGPPHLEETRERRLYAFHADFIKRLRAENVGVFRVKGDSMSPTIRDGAIVLVDCSPITSV